MDINITETASASASPSEISKEYGYEFTHRPTGRKMLITSSGCMFSPRHPDKGTLAMLGKCEFGENDKVLDLGCGSGIVGISAAISGAAVDMCDIDPESVKRAGINADSALLPHERARVRLFVSDGFSALPDNDYTVILSNPPYHTDFSVAKRFIEGAFRHLSCGGRLFLVTKRKLWYKNKLISVFGGVKIFEEDGYFVFTSEKRPKASREKQNHGGARSR